MTSTGDIAAIPLLEGPPPADHAPRQVAFALPHLRRRGFLRVLAVGGMALGLSALSWVPTGRRAGATVGTEYTSCAAGGFDYDDGICTTGAYSPGYCGIDKWYKNGCFRGSDGVTTCYRPVARCQHRNAWRWVHNGVTYRCADGESKCQSCSSWWLSICNARL